MSDTYFREILCVAPSATREDIRRAYRKLVMENHPDRYPSDQKHIQELRLVTMTEAYRFLMTELTGPAAPPAPAAKPREASARSGQVARPRDPAYAYYKQGFINFSVAVHGIAEMNRIIAKQKATGFKPYRVAQDFANSLSLLDAAHGYFARVVEEYDDSVWSADSRAKLRRIERFTAIYKRILANMGYVR